MQKATIQQVLNMDLSNSYSEDYSDPFASSFIHETTLGWRFANKRNPRNKPEKLFILD